ncbi:hypothetical protein FZEAL_7343 [Fusarium zealandicum]|uniref:Uncharacterized protein n=1 Tax=Fusarium zealandicum TaxID=1053134 RepID=A0A8H4UGP5_9HYPO|nr:hypothetical protein FZEAL_7343 [Fusarium zealandicum]
MQINTRKPQKKILDLSRSTTSLNRYTDSLNTMDYQNLRISVQAVLQTNNTTSGAKEAYGESDAYADGLIIGSMLGFVASGLWTILRHRRAIIKALERMELFESTGIRGREDDLELGKMQEKEGIHA